jgi:Ca2+-binding RTX toxin-like protein
MTFARSRLVFPGHRAAAALATGTLVVAITATFPGAYAAKANTSPPRGTPTYVSPVSFTEVNLSVGDDGNVLAVGRAGSDFVPTPGAHDDGGRGNISVQSVDPTGHTRWAARIGGSSPEYADYQAVDSHGNTYLAGLTSSRNFPTTRGALGAGYWDYSHNRTSFLLKLSPAGKLIYSARIPGSHYPTGILVDDSGAVLVIGVTTRKTTGGMKATEGAYDPIGPTGNEFEGYLLKVSPSGSGLVWSTFLGGSSDEIPGGLARSDNGDLAVVGQTRSPDFATTPGSAFPDSPGPFPTSENFFAIKLDPNAESVRWSSYLPGASWGRIVLSRDGRVDILGEGRGAAIAPSGQPASGGLIAQFNADGTDVKMIKTVLMGTSTSPTAGDQIIGLGHMQGGHSYDDMVVRLDFDGVLMGATLLPSNGRSAAGDAVSTYVALTPRHADGRIAAPSAKRPKTSIARYSRCTITGTTRNDVLRGTPGPDVICGLAGNDKILGGGGYDVLIGGPGRDRLYGNAGVDVLIGGTGNDALSGGPSRDLIQGGQGRDTLSGGSGPDRLVGGRDRDHLNGGTGRDSCVDTRRHNTFRACRP